MTKTKPPVTAAKSDVQAISASTIIHRAIAAANKPAGLRRPVGSLRLLVQLSPVKQVRVESEAQCRSASWMMPDYPFRSYHFIRVGLEFPVWCVERIRNQPRKLQRYCEALIRHEAAHGLFTDPDLEGVNKRCEAVGVPFRVLNLLEDARIEHLERERSKNPITGQLRRFHWWCFTPTPKETDRAGCYFWSLINQEASSWSRYSAGAPRWFGKPGADVRIRDYYYHRAIHAAQTNDLIPICQEMCQEFPRPKQDAAAVQAEPTVNQTTAKP